MRLSDKQLQKLRVFTKSKHSLGWVCGFQIDSDQHTVEYYFVGNHSVIRCLWQKKLMIHRSQVISIDNSTMIVDDAFVPKAVPEDREEATASV